MDRVVFRKVDSGKGEGEFRGLGYWLDVSLDEGGRRMVKLGRDERKKDDVHNMIKDIKYIYMPIM